MGSSHGFDLDRMLEQELRHNAAEHQPPTPLWHGSRYQAASVAGGVHMSFLPQFATALSAKAAIGLATAGLVVGGGTAATLATHTVNPVAWGQDVVAAVQQCKLEYGPGSSSTSSPGSENVGRCVSAFASTQGTKERELHSRGASERDLHAHGASAGTAHPGPTAPGSQRSIKAAGEPGALPAQATAPHPGGKPQGRPSGPPSDR
jgi:hypothetical protein